MSKNQKSITSFFKNPGQSSAPKPKPPATVEIKTEPDVDQQSASIPETKVTVSPKKPTVVVAAQPVKSIQREVTHETESMNISDQFLLTNRKFDVQYAHLYAERLGSMRKFVTKAAENHWGR